jgi:hypothetical protein
VVEGGGRHLPRQRTAGFGDGGDAAFEKETDLEASTWLFPCAFVPVCFDSAFLGFIRS